MTVDMVRGPGFPSGADSALAPGNIGLHTVAPGGGDGSLLKLNQGSSEFSTARWPIFPADGRHFLFQVRRPGSRTKGHLSRFARQLQHDRLTASDWSTQYALGYLMFLNGPC